ncbi:putative translation initiation factor 1 [Blattamonas nauphoetae]|uniref:Translation initiation factor 1 n=1 Tax=Blattamonas nauphoetae TaxID=2049346 RepID=A0ABQ9XJS6_9EUKA|nr:putative translation initiation factor 1 [Blattamonas nauphoetae]
MKGDYKELCKMTTANPFDNEIEGTAVGPDGFIHIRVQQRTTRKKVTTITGLSDIVDFKEVVKRIGKKYSVGCTTVEDKEFGTVIRCQGGLQHQLKEFLIENKMAREEQIKIHAG